MTIQAIFSIVVLIFTVGNVAAMALELNVRGAVNALRNTRFVALTFAWSWVIGPALAYVMTKIIPLPEPYALGLILASPAPCAPFYPLVVRKARGDVAFAAAFLLLTAVGSVVFMPLMLPLMIEGLDVSAWAIAKPLLTLVLTPLVIGIAVRVYAPLAADTLFPVVKKIADVFTLMTLLLVLALYGKGMLDSMGSFAIGTQMLFLCAMAFVSYEIGVGLKPQQRSTLALGVGTRNIAAVFAVLKAIPNTDSRLVVMIAMVVPLSAIVALFAARIFAARAGATVAGRTA
jgi:BASS family bile acid:Na+ symporter